MNRIIATLVFTFILASKGSGYCGGDLPDTVKNIKNLLPGISSDVRRETYGYIRFDRCLLDYDVSGLYPIGTPYRKSYSNIDFASLNPQNSKTGADSSDYILLYFDKPFNYKDNSIKRKSNVTVIDTASIDQAQTLFREFLRLGELCRGEAGRLPAETVPPRAAALTGFKP